MPEESSKNSLPLGVYSVNTELHAYVVSTDAQYLFNEDHKVNTMLSHFPGWCNIIYIFVSTMCQGTVVIIFVY